MNKSNKLIFGLCLFLALSLLLPNALSSPGAVAQSPPIIVVYGNTLYTDVAPIIINDRTMVPMRAIFEALGAEVFWNPDWQEITGVRGSDVVVLQINNSLGTLNGSVLEMDAPPLIHQGRTMVPARFVAESLGENVQWDSGANTVYIGNSATNFPTRSILSENQALARVEQVAPPSPGVRLAVMFEENRGGNDYYAIKAYQVIDDGNGESHTAALTWYFVDKNDGSVYDWNMIDDTLTLIG